MIEVEAIVVTTFYSINFKLAQILIENSIVYTLSDEPEKERRKRSRSRSLTPGAEAYQALSLNNAPAANEAQDEDIEAEIEQLTRKKSKKYLFVK